jgi:hypothetical protein
VGEKNKDQEWGERKSDLRRDNHQKVYEVILSLREATTRQIRDMLQKRKAPLSLRTIERCIKGDPRIIKNKKYYRIDERARLETRYLNPKRFGLYIWNDVVLGKSESYSYNGDTMRQMVETFGAIILFAFIEASRQFQDNLKWVKDQKYYKARNDLVLFWAMNSVPLDFMFRTFASVFNYKTAPGKPLPAIVKPNGTARDEMDDLQIRECLDMLEKNYPDIYKDLAYAKNRFYENSLSGKVPTLLTRRITQDLM